MDFWVQLQTIGASWAAAVATAAATGTALWLALSERRQRRRDRAEAVELIATGVAVYLEELRLELLTALASINHGLTLANRHHLAETLGVVGHNVQLLNTSVLTPHEINVLTALPEHAGEKIYTAISCIRSVQSGLTRRLSVVTEKRDGSREVVMHWKTQLEWAHGLIEEALAVCSQYGTIRIIKPKT